MCRTARKLEDFPWNKQGKTRIPGAVTALPDGLNTALVSNPGNLTHQKTNPGKLCHMPQSVTEPAVKPQTSSGKMLPFVDTLLQNLAPRFEGSGDVRGNALQGVRAQIMKPSTPTGLTAGPAPEEPRGPRPYLCRGGNVSGR